MEQVYIKGDNKTETVTQLVPCCPLAKLAIVRKIYSVLKKY